MDTLTRREIALIASLKRSHGRDETKLFTVEGLKSIQEFIREGWVAQYVVVTPNQPTDIPGALVIDYMVMEALSGLTTPPGALAVFQQPEPRQLPQTTTDLLLILDGISDPGNLGTIIRTADWFGIAGIILTGASVEPWNPKVVQATMGSLTRMPMYQIADSAELARHAKQYGWKLLVSDVTAGVSMNASHKPGVLVMGSESHGVSDVLRKAASETVHISGPGKTESLNVAVATGIFLSQWYE